MKNLLFLILFLNGALNCFGQHGIEFQFEIQPINNELSIFKDSTIYDVRGVILNTSDTDLYFLSESCNGLAYYIKSNSENVENYVTLNCNASWPEKIMIKPGSQYLFNTNIRMKKIVDDINLDLKLFLLIPSTDVKGKSIFDVQKENIFYTLDLKGKNIKI